jgi:hypothetical protein
MKCPQCGAENPDDEWNCVSCRINLYWAHQHYSVLEAIRERQGLEAHVPTPPFLARSSKQARRERAARGGNADSKVREIARRVMRGEATEQP